jgi:hypothetical protein
MDCLKSGLDIFLKLGIQTSVVNSHTVTYKPITLADNPAQLEFNCSGHSDYYINLNCVLLHLRIKLLKLMDRIYKVPRQTVVCVKNLLHSMFCSLSVSLNGNPVSFHETLNH